MLISTVCSPYRVETSSVVGREEAGRWGRKSATTNCKLWNPVLTSDSLGHTVHRRDGNS